MASPANGRFGRPTKDLEEVESDYGSDFFLEEEIINKLLSLSSTVTEGREDHHIAKHVNYHGEKKTVRVAQFAAREGRPLVVGDNEKWERISNPDKIDDPGSANPGNIRDNPKSNEKAVDTNATKAGKPDTRSPLEQFRTAPKKSLSVTDLVSPSWCELQYWFTLTIHGRKLQTAAMKRGSAIHQTLEDQIKTTVLINIETKEDAFGLRIWNVIQGLQTLKDIGMTRELEVWGTIEGQVVNGVIDEISFMTPDQELENELKGADRTKKDKFPTDQTILTDFYKGKSIADGSRIRRLNPPKKVYISDIKTRAINRIPRGAAFRPTKIQLMIYHRLLSELATNQVDLSTILKRYSLNGNTPFSDALIAQIESLNDYDIGSSGGDAISNSSQGSSQFQAPSSSPPPSSQDTLSLILEHNSISKLWVLMISELRQTFPDGRASFGDLLRAEYRSCADGALIGSSTFSMDDVVLDMYMAHAMKWWRGEREPEGVVIEEAYKCRSCEFAEACDWRLQRAGISGLQQAWGSTKSFD